MPGALKSHPRMEAKMIPLTKDVAELIGEWAVGVDNRSLLYEKFSLPKVWGAGDGGKINDAGRWSLLRIVTGGSDLLNGDSTRLGREAQGRQVSEDVAEKKERDARIASHMASFAKADPLLGPVATRNAKQFLSDLQSSFAGRIVAFEAALGSRMMVNLAGGVVQNAGIALDRCFGLPLIPGSAVKGITRAQALWEIHAAGGSEKQRLLRFAMILFGYGGRDVCGDGDFAQFGGTNIVESIVKEIGSDDFKGCACFLPAYPTTTPKLVVDMVNPHYPAYYSGRAHLAKDEEKPIPNYFPAVEKGSSFGFAVLLNRSAPMSSVPDDQLLTQAEQWMKSAITRKGIGAKTGAGYGWFEFKSTQEPTTTAIQEVVEPAKSKTDTIIQRFKSLATKDNFPVALPQMAALTDPELRVVFNALVPANERTRLKKGNPYWQAFTSGKAGADGQNILRRLELKLA